MRLGKNVVSREQAKWTLERFAWLIENFCPKYGPLRASLTCVKDGQLTLEHHSHHIEASAGAMASFEAMRYQAGMGRWPVEFVAREKSLPKRDTDIELAELNCHNGNSERYYTDSFGRPVIYFEPTRSAEPGYITRRAALMLSGLLHMSVEKPSAIRADSEADMAMVTGAFLGLGLALAYRTPEQRLDVDNLTSRRKAIFASAVFLSLKGCDFDRVNRLYAGLIEDDDLELLSDAFAQLRHYTAALTKLRNRAMKAEHKEISQSA